MISLNSISIEIPNGPEWYIMKKSLALFIQSVKRKSISYIRIFIIKNKTDAQHIN